MAIKTPAYYHAALSGCVGGMLSGHSPPTSLTQADYSSLSVVCAAFALAVDTAIGTVAEPPDGAPELLQEICHGSVSGRQNSDRILEADWTDVANKIEQCFNQLKTKLT